MLCNLLLHTGIFAHGVKKNRAPQQPMKTKDCNAMFDMHETQQREFVFVM